MSLLLVPVVLAIGGVAFAFVQDSRQQDLEHRRAQADALQAYLDQMSTLLIDEAPKTVIEEGDEKKRRPLQDPTAITVARARTLTILGRVASDRRRPTDQERKRTVLQFLYEARLIQRDQPCSSFGTPTWNSPTWRPWSCPTPTSAAPAGLGFEPETP
jgi:hypothetical protein